jgi:hypothetical protein
MFPMNAPVKVHVKNPNGEMMYKTNAGIPFECVEFVRRHFMQTRGLTFPSVVDATDMFYRIHELNQLTDPTVSVQLHTRIYPYVRPAQYYLRPGTMLFWAPKPTDDLKYGHVALVVESSSDYVIVAQQNKSPPVQMHNTNELFNAINTPNSAYIGVKIVPPPHTFA